MSVITIKRGLDVPIHGNVTSPEIRDKHDVFRVALLPPEAVGIKTKLDVEVGDKVRAGDPLFHDRRDPDVRFGSPASGQVEAIHRGARRAVLSVVIRADDKGDQIDFQPCDPGSADRADVRKALIDSGLFPCIRQRPFDRVAPSDGEPGAVFVTAMDTRPLAASPLAVLAGREEDFKAGLDVVSRLTEGTTWLCVAAGEDWSSFTTGSVQTQAFRGPHPAGNVGVHINALHPVGPNRTAWHVGYQDVAAIGQLFRTGTYPTERIVAITGPVAKEPGLLRTRRGADVAQLCGADHAATTPRFVSGSALFGTTAAPESPTGFLGRYANQVTILEDATQRDLLGWAFPVANRFTLTNTVLDKFFRKRFKFDTDVNGSLRAIVPIGSYEEVMPMDIMATQLIKALSSHDLELAEKLGVLELAEEDIALCEFVDPCKIAVTSLLRDMLTRIEKEG